MTAQKELIPTPPGELLRYRREKVGLTLERAAELSRIKPAVLAAIESGETADIPSVYLRGYIRNYARFLGVDAAQIEENLDLAKGAEPDVRSVFNVSSRRGRTEKWLKASSYLAASAVIAALAWQFTHEAVRFSQRDGEGRDATALEQDAAPGSAETAAAAPPSKTHLNASIAAVELLERRPERSGQAVAEQAWAAIGGQDEASAAIGQEASGEELRQLAFSTSADTWVEILDGEGQQLELDLIRAGSRREYRGKEPFRIMIGRASAVVMTLDGEAVDLGPHTRGNVARLTLGDASGVTGEADAGPQDPDPNHR
jgi:cytoskeleton protein RodZ